MLVIKEGNLLESVSMGASFESSPLSVLYFRGFAITCVYSGSPAGTLKIQVSNDTSNVAADVTIWEDLADSSITISAAGQQVYNVKDVYYNQVKLVYTRTSGTGSMSVKYTGKT